MLQSVNRQLYQLVVYLQSQVSSHLGFILCNLISTQSPVQRFSYLVIYAVMLIDRRQKKVGQKSMKIRGVGKLVNRGQTMGLILHLVLPTLVVAIVRGNVQELLHLLLRKELPTLQRLPNSSRNFYTQCSNMKTGEGLVISYSFINWTFKCKKYICFTNYPITSLFSLLILVLL